MTKEPLLIFRLGSIGDTVVALPCFRAIARAFPEHRRVLLTNGLASVRASSVESVLKGTQLIDETLYYPVGGNALQKFGSLWVELRRRSVRTMVYLQQRPALPAVLRDVLFFRAAGLSQIIGAPWSTRLRQCQIEPASGELEFEAQRLARTLRPEIDVVLSTEEFELQLTEAERHVASMHLGALLSGVSSSRPPLIAIAAGAKWAIKDWGEANWGSLIQSLSFRGLQTLVFIGAADERPLAARLKTRSTAASLNLCGELTPRETAAVLAHCALLICHDSGPMHLAASQRTPCVALFGNLSRPHRWFPYGDRHTVLYGSEGVGSISVARVTDAVEALLRTMS